MTTPRIEEMVEEFAERNDCIMCYGKNQKQLDRLRQALTEAHQAGIEEEKERIKQWVARNYRLDTITIDMPKLMEALQDNK